MLKRVAGIIFIVTVVIPTVAQNSQPKLTGQTAPALRVVAVLLDLDDQNQTVTLSLELENTADKTISSFSSVYRTKEVVRGYNVWLTVDLANISVTLAPQEKKKIVLLEKARVPKSILNMPVAEILIARVTFEDGSTWERAEDK